MTSRSVQVRAPDSHDERFDRVRNEVRRDRRTRIQQTATKFLLGLASCVGPTSGADDIPRDTTAAVVCVQRAVDVVSSGRQRGLPNVGVDRAQS